jgi:iron complex outermembrane receptor protein
MTGDGNGYVGNLDLVPEIAHILSANWSWTDENWALSISPHYTQIDDYIGARRCRSQNMNCGMMNLNNTSGFVYLQFINESARIYGVDASFDAILAESNSGGKLSTQITYSLANGINRQTRDNLPQIMPRNVRLTLSHEYQAWQHDLVLEWVDNKDRLSAVRNEIPTDAYDLLHINGSYKWSENLQLNYGIDNLLDRFYNHPLAGAYLGQGKTMSATGVPWGVPVPGMGRNIYLGLNYQFK